MSTRIEQSTPEAARPFLLNGLDISNHNWPLDPTVVPGDFVIMKATEGKGWRDQRFAKFDTAVRPSRRLAGAYHFCSVIGNAPHDEAANFADMVKDHLRPGFLLVCDWEPRAPHRTDWAVDFALAVKRLTRRTPLLYANHSTLHQWHWARWRAEIGTAYWLAGGTGQYDDRTDGYQPGVRPTNPAGWTDPLCWQYTEYGYLAGWSNRLDLNAFFGTADDWRAIADSGKA